MLASFVHFLSCLFLFSFFLYFQVVLYAHDCSCKMHAVLQRYFLTNPLFGRCVEFPSLSLSTIVHLTRAEYHNNSQSRENAEVLGMPERGAMQL